MCTGIEIAMMLAAGASTAGAIYQADVAEKTADVNAELQRREGNAEKDAAVAQAEKIRRAARQQAGEANAALAASGVSIGEGSAIVINEQIYKDSESDAYSTLLTGTRRQRSANDQAGLTKWQGSAAKTAGYINATSSLLSTGAKVGGGWQSSYNGDASGTMYSQTGADIRGRR